MECLPAAETLSQEWQTLLGPVTFVSEGDAEKTLIGPLPVRAGAVPGPPDAWCADTRAKDSPRGACSGPDCQQQTACGDKPCGLTYVQTTEVTLSCHRTSVIICPGNDEANALAPVQWLEEAPAEDLATQEKDTYQL